MLVRKAAATLTDRLAMRAPAARRATLARMAEETLRHWDRAWSYWAEPEQQPPPGAWRVWLLMAGRGFGKTRAGAEWVRAIAERQGGARIALVGATEEDARRVMIEGESGLLAIAERGARPRWEASKGELSWPSGARAFVYSSANPDGLRGPEHHYAWGDELGRWLQPDATWSNLQLGLRLGPRPRAVATTTPRPIAMLRALEAAEGVAVTRGRMAANPYLPDAFVAAMIATYGGTRLGRQELDGELIEDVEGALWRRELIERARVTAAPALARVAIGVDPPAGATATSDACGIVAVGRGRDGVAYLLGDHSVQGARPEAWARAVAAAAARWGADRVIAEANNGGAMVESVLRAVDAGLPVRLVHASRGKVARAEPVAALYEHGTMRHVGAFPALEDELAGLQIGGGYAGPRPSPDRADALVWAVTELMLGTERGMPRVSVL